MTEQQEKDFYYLYLVIESYLKGKYASNIILLYLQFIYNILPEDLWFQDTKIKF